MVINLRNTIRYGVFMGIIEVIDDAHYGLTDILDKVRERPTVQVGSCAYKGKLEFLSTLRQLKQRNLEFESRGHSDADVNE